MIDIRNDIYSDDILPAEYDSDDYGYDMFDADIPGMEDNLLIEAPLNDALYSKEFYEAVLDKVKITGDNNTEYYLENNYLVSIPDSVDPSAEIKMYINCDNIDESFVDMQNFVKNLQNSSELDVNDFAFIVGNLSDAANNFIDTFESISGIIESVRDDMER